MSLAQKLVEIEKRVDETIARAEKAEARVAELEAGLARALDHIDPIVDDQGDPARADRAKVFGELDAILEGRSSASVSENQPELDSPNFTSPAIAELAARDFVRVNAPRPSEASSVCACPGVYHAFGCPKYGDGRPGEPRPNDPLPAILADIRSILEDDEPNSEGEKTETGDLSNWSEWPKKLTEHQRRRLACMWQRAHRTDSATASDAELDSPPFRPAALDELAARGYERINNPRSDSATSTVDRCLTWLVAHSIERADGDVLVGTSRGTAEALARALPSLAGQVTETATSAKPDPVVPVLIDVIVARRFVHEDVDVKKLASEFAEVRRIAIEACAAVADAWDGWERPNDKRCGDEIRSLYACSSDERPSVTGSEKR